MAHKSCERRHMSDAAIVRDDICRKVRDVVALGDGNRKSAFAFAARVLNLPFDRVRRLYYGQARRIEAHEADQIRAYVQAAEKLIRAREEYGALRQQFLSNAAPSLARLVPPPAREDEVSQAAREAATTAAIAEFQRRKRRA